MSTLLKLTTSALSTPTAKRDREHRARAWAWETSARPTPCPWCTGSTARSISVGVCRWVSANAWNVETRDASLSSMSAYLSKAKDASVGLTGDNVRDEAVLCGLDTVDG